MKKKGTTKKAEKAKKGTAKKALPKKPVKAGKKTAPLSVTLDGMEIGPGKKRGKTAADIEECKKALNDARKANSLLDAHLGFMEHVGFKTSDIKAVYMMNPKPAKRTPRKATAKKAKKAK